MSPLSLVAAPTRADFILASLWEGGHGARLMAHFRTGAKLPDGCLEAYLDFAAGEGRSVAAREEDDANAHGARLVTPLCPDYPDGLQGAVVLRVRGQLPRGPCLAIVGTRKADRYGRDVATRIAQAASARGVAVISGGAFGVDAAAHEGALASGGQTVVVLGSGLAHASPREHAALFDRVREAGAVVSAMPMQANAARHTFVVRNAHIAGLALATVVVQAGALSGALHTARFAKAAGRPVYAVPGPIDAPLHAGCHALIRRGAHLLTRADSWAVGVLDPGLGVDKSENAHGNALVSSAGLVEPSRGNQLWLASGAEPVSLAELARAAGLTIGEASSAALELELAGHFVSSAGGRFSRSTPQSSRVRI